MVADVPYRFNIVNCEKLNSQFNFGKFTGPCMCTLSTLLLFLTYLAGEPMLKKCDISNDIVTV